LARIAAGVLRKGCGSRGVVRLPGRQQAGAVVPRYESERAGVGGLLGGTRVGGNDSHRRLEATVLHIINKHLGCFGWGILAIEIAGVSQAKRIEQRARSPITSTQIDGEW
jgi:hypothetical protein